MVLDFLASNLESWLHRNNPIDFLPDYGFSCYNDLESSPAWVSTLAHPEETNSPKTTNRQGFTSRRHRGGTQPTEEETQPREVKE